MPDSRDCATKTLKESEMLGEECVLFGELQALDVLTSLEPQVLECKRSQTGQLWSLWAIIQSVHCAFYTSAKATVVKTSIRSLPGPLEMLKTHLSEAGHENHGKLQTATDGVPGNSTRKYLHGKLEPPTQRILQAQLGKS